MSHEVREWVAGDAQLIRNCFKVFTHLRPHLTEEEFIARVGRQQEDGYSGVYVISGPDVVAAAGYRVVHFLAWGKVLYIDDLITHPDHKRQGLAGTLLTWLVNKARQLGCDEVHLDTGHDRHHAHRLYLNRGFVLSCHHMSLKL